MRALTLAVAAGTMLVAAQANAGSFPVNTMTGIEPGLVDTVAVRVFVHEGRRYCFYFDGWHGPGWYRCGFAWRRGLGWGGVYGWNDWTYGPWERRHHRQGNWREHRRGDRIGVGPGSTRSRNSSEIRSRSRSTTGAGVDSDRRMRGDSNMRVRSGGDTRMRSTTGRGGADVQGSGNVRTRGGSSAAPNAAPGASSGPSGGPSGGAAAGGGAGAGGGPNGERK